MYGIEYDKDEDLELFEEDLKTSKTVHIKEFDMNSMPPLSDKDKSGVKIVVIGKPGCFARGTKVLMYNGSLKNVEDVIGDMLNEVDGDEDEDDHDTLEDEVLDENFDFDEEEEEELLEEDEE